MGKELGPLYGSELKHLCERALREQKHGEDAGGVGGQGSGVGRVGAEEVSNAGGGGDIDAEGPLSRADCGGRGICLVGVLL